MKISELRKKYKRYEKDVLSKISEFSAMNSASEEQLFKELVFCLLTPQSKAKNCWAAVEKLCELNKLNSSAPDELKKYLKGVRFHNNKSRYIAEARSLLEKIGGIRSILKRFKDNSFAIREYLVENIKGFGYKEASHFLRNIGFGKNLAILDRHILKNLKNTGVIKSAPAALSKKKYLMIEAAMRKYSKQAGIPMDCLDLFFWASETGEVFK